MSKLLKRLKQLEKIIKPKITWPTFQQFYLSDEDHRAWFETHNPHINYDEWRKSHKTFQDMYEQ